jgi:uncharacterized protein YukJ
MRGGSAHGTRDQTMPIRQYSVLKGRPIDARRGSGSSPHYQVLVVDDVERYRIAVNVESQDGSEVQYSSCPTSTIQSGTFSRS